MSWRITAAGTVTLDDVTTPVGRRHDQQGGSAVYFALAAAPLARVHICGVVGEDGEAGVRETFDGTDVELSALAVSPGASTFRWRAIHDFSRWVTAEEEADEGAYAGWVPDLGEDAASAPVLFLGSMRPDLQVAVLQQSRARLVGADSMTVFIGARGDEVRAVAAASDVLFLNRSELGALTGAAEDDWLDAARSLCGTGRLRAVVVKAGPLGAACVTRTAVVDRAASAVAAVVDPTGAGDALAGGFLGACARAERDDEAFFATALDSGLRRAAAAITTFGVAGLCGLTRAAAPATPPAPQ